MAQPPVRPVMARELTRSVPFITPRTFNGVLGFPGTVSAEFDCLEGFADPNLFNNVGAYPGTNTPKIHAVGPWLDAALFSDQACLIRVEYSVDRGCAYRQAVPDTAVAASSFSNLSGLRITGRFVRISLINNSGAANANVEFGVYIRST